MTELAPTLETWLEGQGLPAGAAVVLAALAGVAALAAAAWLANWCLRRLILRGVEAVVRRTAARWDDVLLECGVFARAAHLASALVVSALGPVVFGRSHAVLGFTGIFVNLYLVGVAVGVADALLSAWLRLAERNGLAARVAMKGFVQAAKLAVFLGGGVFALSILLGKSPLLLLSGIGALTAVLLLVFKDAILGFVAGIMISVNQMVRVGDWIEIPPLGVDGFVRDVSLTTVLVQGWDKAMHAVPAYALISSPVKNWRGMFDAGGRRIRRALCIDMQTVRFADGEMLARWRRIGLLQPYLEAKEAEIAADNAKRGGDPAAPGNSRRLTNLGTFRAYCEAYLHAHPLIHSEMTFVVRQLAPSEHGLPIEIYVFVKDTRWARYEAVQADIFDHLLAVIGEFGLAVYQQPSGLDLRRLRTDPAGAAAAT